MFIFQAKDTKVSEVEFNPEFIARMIPKLEWPAVCQAAEDLGIGLDLPREVISDYQTNENFLRKAHHVLMEVCKQDSFFSNNTGLSFIYAFDLVY